MVKAMRVSVQVVRDKIVVPLKDDSAHSGAEVVFQGIVRNKEEGELIDGLVYEAYESMAVKEMKRIIEGLCKEQPCHEVEIIHRIGRILVGEVAIYVRVLAAHRQEAFACCMGFMDRLKQEVPIWKVGVYKEDKK